ncbi:hypothetical protein, partial [Escherichia coli]|uniref:hypothetical protein n=1 Tax=Escherichia coli TaxID=562 RepID=UPI0019431EC0
IYALPNAGEEKLYIFSIYKVYLILFSPGGAGHTRHSRVFSVFVLLHKREGAGYIYIPHATCSVGFLSIIYYFFYTFH